MQSGFLAVIVSFVGNIDVKSEAILFMLTSS